MLKKIVAQISFLPGDLKEKLWPIFENKDYAYANFDTLILELILDLLESLQCYRLIIQISNRFNLKKRITHLIHSAFIELSPLVN